MPDTKELFSEAKSLPIEMRTHLVEELLQSLNPTSKEIDKLWGDEAEKRLTEIKTGKVKTIPGDQVFKKIRIQNSECRSNAKCSMLNIQ